MARRGNYNRRHRRGRFGFLYKLISVLVICAAVIAALTLFFRVDTITVSGESRYTSQQVLDASGLKTGENLFLLNKYAVANSLLEKLPYIETVRINRKLPDTLLIDVTECSSTIAAVQDGTAWLISPSGKIVGSCAPAEASDQPVLDGCKLLAPSVGSQLALAKEQKQKQESLLALLGALEDAGLLDQLNAVHLDDASELVMDYAGRFAVEMPYGADYAYKLRNLTAVMEQLESNEKGTVDLTKDGEAHVLPS
jgi:Cell division septal protein